MFFPRIVYLVCLASVGLLPLVAQPTPLERARDLYRRTEYKQTLSVLASVKNPDVATLQLIAQAHYGQGDYKQATDTLERAIPLAAKNSVLTQSDLFTWLGRAYGRRAETAFALMAPRYAGKAREALEKALQLNPDNHEALDDLFEFYLQAPGFLGGGIDKAEALAKHMAELEAAWGQRAQARVKEERKDFSGAEQSLRRAVELAPKQVGRVVDLAKYLAGRGKTQESDAMFAQAAKLSPDDPQVMFVRAQTYVEQKRNLSEARQLLVRYLASPLTPDHPSRAEAQELLKKLDANSVRSQAQ